MGLFNWFRSKRPPQQPPPLPVRYGLGPLPPPTPSELCPLCGGAIVERRLAVRSEIASVWRGRCSACDTVSVSRYAADTSPAWWALVPASEQLLAPVANPELEALSARFGSLMFYERDWAEFRAARRPGDEVWWFADEDGREGLAVVRRGRPLAQFLLPDPDRERRLREDAARDAERRAARARCTRGMPSDLTVLPSDWRTSTAVVLARLMYDSRDFGAMPILADALQDAGCDNDELLTHCRETGPHVCGCWVVDLVLGKE
jgi:hypothetical protein